MTKQEAIERIGGRKRALSIVGVGCLVPVLLGCGLLFSGAGCALRHALCRGGWLSCASMLSSIAPPATDD